MNYKQILENIINNGTPKQPVRFDSNNNPVPVENSTIGTFAEVFRHDMSEGFPLTTLRRMPFKQTCQELQFFISGNTDKTWLNNLNNVFWKYWANPQKVKDRCYKAFLNGEGFGIGQDASIQLQNEKLQKKFQEEETDLGPLGYSWEWRKFGQHYGDNSLYKEENGLQIGFDQLKSMVDKLKTNPYDRRMITSFWNPNQLDKVALPSCHLLHQVVVYGNKLNLSFYQRSCDWVINQSITTYGLLMLLLCEESGLEPGELVGVFADCHVYDNQLPAIHELLKREEKDLPQVKIKRKPDGSFSIFDWTWEEVELMGYDPHPPLNMGSVTV
jgi:thymidylate synthase